MKNKFLAVLSSCSLILAASQSLAQEDQPDNYIPDTLDMIMDRPAKGEAEIPIKEKVSKETIVNSIFLYEGYPDSKKPVNEGFGERFMENLEEEVNKTSPLRLQEYSYDLEYAENVPFEREMYSAMGKTLIEKYKFFRTIDDGIKKVRDATTVKYESNGGVKYRLGAFVNKAETGEIGAFLKIKNGSFDIAFLACQNELESYMEKRARGFRFRLSYNYKTGASGDRPERETYFSIGR